MPIVSACVFKNTLWLKNLKQDKYHWVGLVFSESKGLETVEIPKSVESIGFGAFRSCENLKEVRFAEGSELKKLMKVLLTDV